MSTKVNAFNYQTNVALNSNVKAKEATNSKQSDVILFNSTQGSSELFKKRELWLPDLNGNGPCYPKTKGKSKIVVHNAPITIGEPLTLREGNMCHKSESVTQKNKNGKTEITADGTLTKQNKNGSTTQVKADGTVTVTRKDGTTQGVKIPNMKDSGETKVTVNEDGTILVQNGKQKILINDEGTMTISAEDKKYRVNKDGDVDELKFVPMCMCGEEGIWVPNGENRIESDTIKQQAESMMTNITKNDEINQIRQSIQNGIGNDIIKQQAEIMMEEITKNDEINQIRQSIQPQRIRLRLIEHSDNCYGE